LDERSVALILILAGWSLFWQQVVQFESCFKL